MVPLPLPNSGALKLARAGTAAKLEFTVPMNPLSHQCPYCELRFGEEWELRHHVAADHPDRPPLER